MYEFQEFGLHKSAAPIGDKCGIKIDTDVDR